MTDPAAVPGQPAGSRGPLLARQEHRDIAPDLDDQRGLRRGCLGHPISLTTVSCKLAICRGPFVREATTQDSSIRLSVTGTTRAMAFGAGMGAGWVVIWERFGFTAHWGGLTRMLLLLAALTASCSATSSALGISLKQIGSRDDHHGHHRNRVTRHGRRRGAGALVGHPQLPQGHGVTVPRASLATSSRRWRAVRLEIQATGRLTTLLRICI
jgi:hypothetical protein